MKTSTSTSQFLMMIDFMEQHGDLSKPLGGPHGRSWVTKWQELTALLNSDPSGPDKTDEKWRKVWSDLKNNVKKKVAKINKSVNGTGGGPALSSFLTDVEQRLVAIVGIQAATGLNNVQEAGFAQVEEQHEENASTQGVPSTPAKPASDDWNLPGSSQEPATWPPEENNAMPPPIPLDPAVLVALPPTGSEEESWQPPPKKKKRAKDATDLFVESETNARAYERERDERMLEMERERIRQRDVELQLQAQWPQFMRDGMKLLERFLNERARKDE